MDAGCLDVTAPRGAAPLTGAGSAAASLVVWATKPVSGNPACTLDIKSSLGIAVSWVFRATEDSAITSLAPPPPTPRVLPLVATVVASEA